MSIYLNILTTVILMSRQKYTKKDPDSFLKSGSSL